LRTRITAPFGTDKDALQAQALADDKVKPFVDGKQIVKVIAVPDKLLNIVVK
jgi:leucyl-tRNA synthetase